jgi:prepilin-type N-terminal cleavage/methylation domain-containing protein
MKGFTLIELLVVIAIVAILLSLAMTALSKSRDTARGAICKNNLHQLATSIQMYSFQYNDLPDACLIEGMISEHSLSIKLENFLDAPKPEIGKRVNPWCCPFDERYYKLCGGSYHYAPASLRNTYTLPVLKIYESIPRMALLTDISPRKDSSYHLARIDGSVIDANRTTPFPDTRWLFDYRR